MTNEERGRRAEPIASLESYRAYMADGAVEARFRLEEHLAEQHRDDPVFHLHGICEVDDAPVAFLVDRASGAIGDDGLWRPNWRERLVCPLCELNCRQRAVLAALLSEARSRPPGEPLRIYAMEQVTPFYAALAARVGGAQCFGSEFLGKGHRGGESVDGIRHEDAEALSFADASLDIVVSNDVLEHVPHPLRALSEAARVLRPGGSMLVTIPFDTTRRESLRRAELREGRIEHLLPAEYHGDPLGGRALVYTTFGWDFLGSCIEAGFRRCEARPYWSLEHGYLGVGHLLFRAEL